MVEEPTNRTKSHRWGSRIGTYVVGFFLLCAVVIYSTAEFGWIEGEEFSPQSFGRRLFSYYEIPLLRWQVTPVSRVGNNGDLENYLLRKGLIVVAQNPRDRWDLAWATRGGSHTILGDSQIFCRYLDATDEHDGNVWLNWTKEHSLAAKEFWPHVARLAEQELYILIPELFSLASADADTTKQRCTETLTRRYFELAENQQQLQEDALAVELYGQALALTPDFVAALQGRARSHLRLGNTRLAEADFAKIRKVQP